MSTLAVFLLLGSATAFATSGAGKNSVGTRQLRNNAVTGQKVLDGSLSGSDVNASTLGQVPSAASAVTAKSAGTAALAKHADNVAHADIAGFAGNVGHAKETENVDFAVNSVNATLAQSLGAPGSPIIVGTEGAPPFGETWIGTVVFYVDQEQEVHLRGAAEPDLPLGTSGPPLIFTLPPAYTPAQQELFPVAGLENQVLKVQSESEIAIEPDGRVLFKAGLQFPVNLSGITWRVGQ